MVTQFLRLKLRLTVNMFRRSVWQVIGITLALLYGLGMAVALFLLLVALRLVPDYILLKDVLTVVGSTVVVGFIILPLIFGVDDTMDPRKFSLFGISNGKLAFGLFAAAFIGVPALVLGIVLAGSVVTWTRGAAVTTVAVISAVLVFITCLLLARVTAALAALLLATRRARELMGAIGILLIVAISPVAVALTTVDWTRDGLGLLHRVGRALGWTPLGAAFSAPGDAAAGDWGATIAKLAIAAGTFVVIYLIWMALIARMVISPGREAAARRYRGLGWFDRMPQGQTGAIAARSITYWLRDARYWVSLIMVPIVPIIAVFALNVGGVPMQYVWLLPVPIMCLFLGWSIHNDTAYDSTAIWLHLASGVRGIKDRIGRLIPVLILGVLVIGLGSAATVLLIDDWRVLPSVAGVASALLFGGLGIGSFTSAQFPYPAAKPGDSPFQQPQAAGTLIAFVQTVTMFVTLVIAAPAIIFAFMGLRVGPSWHLVSFIVGIGAGLVVLVLGTWAGARVFNSRGPEILSNALQA